MFCKNDGTSIYKYAGIRSSNNTSGTKTLLKQIVDLISGTPFKKFEILKSLLTELGFKSEMILQCKSKIQGLNKIFDSINSLDNYFINWDKRSKRKTIPFNVNNYKKLDKETKEKILNFLNEKAEKGTLYYDLLKSSEFELFKKDYEFIKLLQKLDLFKTPELLFGKDEKYNSELELSSGEYNLIFQFLRILFQITDNSLLLIDEPEISLHPNWQIKYIALLEKLLSPFKGIHAIIATHSHLLLANLNPENTTVATITPTTGYELVDYSVSGWSPENILYNVFGVTSFRNFYFEQDLIKLVGFIENPEKRDRDKIQKILSKLDRFKLSEDDPLGILLSDARELINV